MTVRARHIVLAIIVFWLILAIIYAIGGRWSHVWNDAAFAAFLIIGFDLGGRDKEGR